MNEPLLSLTPAPIAGPRASASAAPEELRRVAQDFESMVLSELLAPMFEALDTEGLGGGGFGEQMIRPMLVREYSAAIAGRGGIGIAEAVLAELIRAQSAAAEA